jgi:outer membrane protein TolC
MRKKIPVFLIVLTTAFVLVSAIGDAALASNTIDLQDVVRIALKNNLQILAAKEELEKAKGKYIYARSAALPSISIEGSSSRRNEEATPDRENSVSVELSQYLYAGGIINAGIDQARLALAEAQQSLKNTEESVIFNAVATYLEVLEKKAEVETAREALAYYEEAVKNLGKRLKLGMTTQLDYSRAKQKYKSAEADYEIALNSLSVAKIELYTILSLPPDADVDIVGNLDNANIGLDEEEFPINVDKAIDLALEKRPDLWSIKIKAQVQKLALDIAKGGMKPTITLSASHQLAYDSSSVDNNDDWKVKMAVDIPVFDGGATRGKVMQEKATLGQLEKSVLEKEEAIRAEVNQAILSLENAIETVRITKENLKLAEENLRLAEIGYGEGVNTQLDVLSARTTLTDVRKDLTTALKTYRLALFSLWKAEGCLVNKILEHKDSEGGTK